jgi:hypothetical protein
MMACAVSAGSSTETGLITSFPFFVCGGVGVGVGVSGLLDYGCSAVFA